MKILIKEIAQKAEVSIATVSRVINSSDYVKKETRERVEKVIEKLKSEKKYFGISDSSKVSTVAIIVPNIGNHFFSKVIEGIEGDCFKNDFLPVIFNSKESEEVEDVILKRLKNVKASGLIITPINNREKDGRSYIEALESLKIPIILLDRDLYYGNYDSVYIDNLEGGFLAVEALVQNGHKRIGIIRGPQNSKSGKDRYRGFEKGIKINSLEIPGGYVKEGDFGVESGYNCMKELLNEEITPTAVFICNNMMTLGALNYLNEKGIVVGKDISIICFDDIEELGFENKNISTVSYSAINIGEIAAELLFEKIKFNYLDKAQSKRVVLKPLIKLKGSEKYRGDL